MTEDGWPAFDSHLDGMTTCSHQFSVLERRGPDWDAVDAHLRTLWRDADSQLADVLSLLREDSLNLSPFFGADAACPLPQISFESLDGPNGTIGPRVTICDVDQHRRVRLGLVGRSKLLEGALEILRIVERHAALEVPASHFAVCLLSLRVAPRRKEDDDENSQRGDDTTQHRRLTFLVGT